MKMKLLISVILMIAYPAVNAQQFINSATIEYEVRTNIKKTIGNTVFSELIKDKIPEFKTCYYAFTFADNKSIFKFDHWDSDHVPAIVKGGDEENEWFYDFNNQTYSVRKSVSGTNLNIQDSIHRLKWKLSNENRIIAGFNCRKATAILFDSVYVFAFYTEEITLPGGPVSINGLPGTILGVTIPRLFSSWIATKVTVNEVKVNEIKPIQSKKSYSYMELKSILEDRTRDWYTNDESQKKELQEQKARYIWNALL